MWLKIIIFSLFVISLSKPFIYSSQDSYHKRGRDLVLVLDASGSMAESGFDKFNKFKTKFDITLELTDEFIKNRFDDNIGAVIFGTFAYSASPLTYDLNSLSFLLSMTGVGVAGENTAIGDGIIEAIRVLSYGKAKNRAIILLTDGYHNSGNSSPKNALKEAISKGIKIYTIGIGKNGSYDKNLLLQIAKDSGAKSYSAINKKELESVLDDINSLEPSPIRGENFLNAKQLFIYPLLLAFILLIILIIYKKREIE
ncbi:BatA (Bacteroides aerotolerance operon) [hydrothermal vent metagenome]|uniref:BatA (Bacteroides aerotolerance operon) n=1 Tax=hydrothermal vent metagenome TaxID=652676 RepID=A0A1W1BQ24_9ZZZZ